ncbi:MAG: tRNA (N6-isopentenyl adenosine(37)-C2)-methylthiotransferase MiaB [candidate division Zixibacteria bacterium]|nr:tRNA (N6-isopentenyl adenosine(37)-C2)-methylthiotransferase MiaB [candidate division Zixibacteria bacterium]
MVDGQEKLFHLRTFGCQMNEYDSDLLTDLLVSKGWKKTGEPSRSNLIIYNTCSVREKAEQRALAHIRNSAAIKQQKPDIKLIVIGCMAQRVGEYLVESCPEIDFVLGPDYLYMLPDLVYNGFSSEKVYTSLAESSKELRELFNPSIISGAKDISAFVAISRGCENFCSYCIVPHVRGPVGNRKSKDIMGEVKALVSHGVMEITFLGQNVNAYREGDTDFADLLRMAGEIEGLKRIRFTTSHPKDVSEKLFAVMAEIPAVCEHLHLPLQSGSDRILSLMNRGYSLRQYKDSIDIARDLMPDLCLTTDLIAGFPTETEEEFEMTLRAVEEIGFDAAFMFRYSNRPGTAAAKIEDYLTDEVRIKRLNKLIRLQQNCARQSNQRLLGNLSEVLIDGKSKKDSSELKGKDRGGRTVVVKNSRNLKVGDIINVKINQADSWTLTAEQL